MSNQNAIDLLTELEDLKKVNKGLQQKLAANPTSNTVKIPNMLLIT